jgi:hypothetical protein
MSDDRPTSEILAEDKSMSQVRNFDPVLDLPVHHGVDGDSFYVVSYLEAGGRKFTVLFHQLLMNSSPKGPIAQLALSILDEKDDYYFSSETNYPLEMASTSRSDTDARTAVQVRFPTGCL